MHAGATTLIGRLDGCFFLKKNTPTVMWQLIFAIEALVESYEITRDKNVLNIAMSSANFVLATYQELNMEKV